MGVDFDWTYDEEDSPFGRDGKKRSPRRPGRAAGWIALGIGAVLLVGLTWAATYWSAVSTSPQLEEAVRTHLQLEQDAVLNGNGNIFFSLQSDDPAWRAVQLQLTNQVFNAASREPIAIERRGQDVHVTLRSQADGSGPVERVAFYQWLNGVLTRTATDPAFWGDSNDIEYEWGRFTFFDRDRESAPAIGEHINAQVEAICATDCGANRLPLTVTITPDFSTTAAPGHVRVPSPHLLGRDNDGNPGALFLAELDARLADYLKPAIIRFGVPARHAEKYQLAAEEFGRQQSQIAVEVVPISDDEIPIAAEFEMLDGALFAPPADLIARGHILDLTDYAASDPTYKEADLHPLAMDGARWRDRLWMMPLYAQAPLLIIDSQAHAQAGLAANGPQDWPTLQQNVASIMTTADERELRWGFLDLGNDALFAYALGVQCPGAVNQPCKTRLGEQAVAAALTWYRKMVAEEKLAPNITELDYQGRIDFALNNQSNPRGMAAWVDLPVYYEHHIQIAPFTVHQLPGLNERQLTPVRVTGGFINTTSAHPRAVWTWLNYLSEQRPVNQPRALPARISVRDEIDYWGQIPHPLKAPLRDSIRNARAIRLDEQRLFRFDDLARLLDGESLPEVIAKDELVIEWFEW